MTDSSTLPYKQITEYPNAYNAAGTVTRFIDGLGYRYYWATEGLSEKDLAFKPSDAGMSTYQTIEHMYWLSILIVRTANNQISVRLKPEDYKEMDFPKLRKATLMNFQEASTELQDKTDGEISKLQVQIQSGEETKRFSFWHLMNGPIADALYHTGQIVSFRRSSGNPIHPGVSVFLGKTREL